MSIKTTLIVVAATLILGWIVLGDKARPVMRAATGTVRERVIKLVGKYRVLYEEADYEVNKAIERSQTLGHKLFLAEAKKQEFHDRLNSAETDLRKKQFEVEMLEERISQKVTVRTKEGLVLTEEQVQVKLDDLKQRVQFAHEKVSELQSVYNEVKIVTDSLKKATKEAPLRLARLVSSRNLLKDRIDFYEEMSRSVPAGLKGAGDKSIFDRAEQKLAEAHAALSGEINSAKSFFDDSKWINAELELSSIGKE